MWTVFYSKTLGEYENLDELNYLASKLDEMSESEYAQSSSRYGNGPSRCGSLQEIINLTENLVFAMRFTPISMTMTIWAAITSKNWTLCRCQSICRITSTMRPHGRDVALEDTKPSTDQGYVRDTGDSFHEYYDGERAASPTNTG